MESKTTLRILMNSEFRPTLRRVMEKWPDPKDTFCFVKIARIIDSEIKDYLECLKGFREKLGFKLHTSGDMSVDLNQIMDSLLLKYGKFSANGQPTLAGVSDSDKAEFLAKKEDAEKCCIAYKDAVDSLLDQEFILEIPRQIRVTEKVLKKEALTAQDCFTLEPILDLSAVMDKEEEKPSEEE